jgi:hypothetical protein
MITYPIPNIAFSKSEPQNTNTYLLCVDNAGDGNRISQHIYPLVGESNFGLALTKALANEFSVPMMYLEELPGSHSFRKHKFSLSRIKGWWINVAFLESSREFLHITVLKIVGADMIGFTSKPFDKKLRFMGKFESLMVSAQNETSLHVAYRKSDTPNDEYFHSLKYRFLNFPKMRGSIRTITIDKQTMSIGKSKDEIRLQGIHIADQALICALERNYGGDGSPVRLNLEKDAEATNLVLHIAASIASDYNVGIYSSNKALNLE